MEIPKEQKLEIYKDTLALIKKRAEECGLGICYYMTQAIEFQPDPNGLLDSPYDCLSRADRKIHGTEDRYPEVSRHEPLENKTSYWDLSPAGDAKGFYAARINILEQAIKELK